MAVPQTTQGFGHTPTDPAEFYKPLDELKRNYSDIGEYYRTVSWPTDAPQKDDLQALWGEPEVKKKWGSFLGTIGLCIGLTAVGWLSYPVLGAVVLLSPVPNEEYVWKKGNYEITANGRADVFVDYEKRIHNWKWKEVNKEEKVAQQAEK